MAKKNAVSAKAARLLRKAVAHILEEPRRYDQNEVLTFQEPGTPFGYSYLGKTYKTPPCGTIGCLAAWVTALSWPKAKGVNAILYATRKLGLTSEQRWSLFGSVSNWPDKFAKAYRAAKTPRAVAKVAQKRVEYFIKTGE